MHFLVWISSSRCSCISQLTCIVLQAAKIDWPSGRDHPHPAIARRRDLHIFLGRTGAGPGIAAEHARLAGCGQRGATGHRSTSECQGDKGKDAKELHVFLLLYLANTPFSAAQPVLIDYWTLSLWWLIWLFSCDLIQHTNSVQTVIWLSPFSYFFFFFFILRNFLQTGFTFISSRVVVIVFGFLG